jgi:tRNA pseudouridine38-40 synthase
MLNIKLILSYDGTGLLGWQKTPLGPTVEEHLERALAKVLQEEVSLQAASRTDAGVHAEGQVVNFLTKKTELDLEKLWKGLNSLLPKQIVILSAEKMQEGFHPTLDNKGKEYHYFLCNTSIQRPKDRFYSWHFPYPLDVPEMKSAIPHFLGSHDFSTFCNELPLFKKSKKDPVCMLHCIEIETLEIGRFCFKVKGDRFLFRMVRNLIGTLAYVGCGKLGADQIPDLLKSRKRALAGVTAPSHGLHLVKVFY